jgi:hypothetical protein
MKQYGCTKEHKAVTLTFPVQNHQLELLDCGVAVNSEGHDVAYEGLDRNVKTLPSALSCSAQLDGRRAQKRLANKAAELFQWAQSCAGRQAVFATAMPVELS